MWGRLTCELCGQAVAGVLSVCLDSKTVRDKEGRGKHTPTTDDWVNSVNTGFKVAELLTKMNPRILIFSIGSGSLKRATVRDSKFILGISLHSCSTNPS